MWKKILVSGVVLGVISFGLFFCGRLVNNYDLYISGFNFKTVETLGAFGMAIALGIIAISVFARLCLSEK
jgi:hypothetical protein